MTKSTPIAPSTAEIGEFLYAEKIQTDYSPQMEFPSASKARKKLENTRKRLEKLLSPTCFSVVNQKNFRKTSGVAGFHFCTCRTLSQRGWLAQFGPNLRHPEPEGNGLLAPPFKIKVMSTPNCNASQNNTWFILWMKTTDGPFCGPKTTDGPTCWTTH